jgi:hypothetical protein
VPTCRAPHAQHWLRRAAKGPVDVTLGRDVPVALQLVQHVDLRARRRIRFAAADLARTAAAPDLGLEEQGLADLVVLQARAGLVHEVHVLTRGRAECGIVGKSHLHTVLHGLAILGTYLAAAGVTGNRGDDGLRRIAVREPRQEGTSPVAGYIRETTGARGRIGPQRVEGGGPDVVTRITRLPCRRARPNVLKHFVVFGFGSSFEGPSQGLDMAA